MATDMWDILQQLELNDLRKRQTDVESAAIGAAYEKTGIERRMAKLELVCQGLYELLREKGGITDEELRRKVKQIDARDGSVDQRMSPGPVMCPKCGKTTTAGALTCPQCGATIAPSHPFAP